MNKIVWFNETMKRLLKKYGGRGRQLSDLCMSGEMDSDDARDYRKAVALLEV